MLSLAAAVAVSPLPLIAVLAILLGRSARRAGVALLAGWATGIAAVVSVAGIVAEAMPDEVDDGRPLQATVQLTLAAVAFALAVVSWLRRPRAGAAPRLPRWLQAVDRLSFPAAFAVGFLLIPLSPKNLVLTITAGLELASADLDLGQAVAAVAVFTVIAASPVLLPVAAYLLWTVRLHRRLEVLRLWLIRHNAVITTVLLTLVGVWLTANGLSNL
ncbi:GAP family protein [Microbacterium sp. BK668]|uniref:GAP family protein n=1 Tax=Microbacterium sp. BK668 TaxID=2512118 RepID=UPI0010F15E20|nr:GAP family protein [Microbacterium sp. BK668]TDN90943.1 Sap-like sulfolipid-1-addressing protein [Microbacterium sp. BK668]